MREMKLIFVSEDNHNKFINIKPNSDTFTVTYGRVGSDGSTKEYPSYKSDSYVRSKLNKGYTDITDFVKESDESSEWDIDDSRVKYLVEDLLDKANKNISDNYIISNNITQRQIDEVQGLIDSIYSHLRVNDIGSDIDLLNKWFTEIYKVIPRKMKNTKDYFIQHSIRNKDDYNKVEEMIVNEQQMIDNLKANVKVTDSEGTLKLSDFGIEIEVADDKDRDLIRKLTDFRLTNHKVWKVTNKETEANFNPNKVKTKLLYHGSRTANYWSILTKGLKIRPSGVPTTGSMFGNGIYAADKARKSIGYTSLGGSYWANGNDDKAYLCIFEFATGKELNVFKGGKRWDYTMSDLDEDKVKSKGCDSVFAEGGADLKNNEYIVYNSNQCTIRYIIEIKK